MVTSNDGYGLALFVLQKLACIPSALGSLMIISQVARSEFNRRKPQQRLLLGISVVDFQTSVVWAFTPLFMPAGSGALFASGNQTTCDAQGFVVQFQTAGILYMCALQLQYLLVIKYGWKDRDVAKREAWFHALPITFGAATAAAALALKQYNPANWDCWIAPLPQDCTSSHEVNQGTTHLAKTDCVRGDNANIYRWAFFFAPLWVSILFCIVAMILIYQTMKQTEETSRRHRFSLNFGHRKNRNRGTRGVSEEVKKQSIRYSSAFFVVWTFPTVARVIQLFGGDIHPLLTVVSGTTIGLQGFFNALIYFRPRYNKCVRYKSWYRKVWALIHSTLFPCCYDGDYTKDSLDYVATQTPTSTNVGEVRNERHLGEKDKEKHEEGEHAWNSCAEEEIAIPAATSPGDTL